jgi:hypothetical protein
MNYWDTLTERMNARTIKNPRLGAIPLTVETDIMPTELMGLIDDFRWENDEAQNTHIRRCDAQAWLLTSELADTEAKPGDRIINPATDEIFVILSLEARRDGTTRIALRKYAE